ncbi:hypothetical protein PAECIP111893_00719 [Paenibacillus plantiphilus]|uniref:Uncharacterized protein n=1 Tax=Paenibacillus plantiphilus TaxID=2905650 RepID=A0ABN8G4U6_9BACL|nr:hypothetical protein PAECIP111893_00719 [Paenibacillus plantiphilus]
MGSAKLNTRISKKKTVVSYSYNTYSYNNVAFSRSDNADGMINGFHIAGKSPIRTVAEIPFYHNNGKNKSSQCV